VTVSTRPKVPQVHRHACIDLIVFWLRDTAAEMVRYDIFKPLVRYNFGEDAADELLPKTSYGDTEARDWAVDAAAAAKLAANLTESNGHT
jgi:phage gp29-like protein